jgi:hypothetical protein
VGDDIPNLGICALCRNTRQLRQSHIVPEFAYKPIYDEKHRLISFSPLDIDAKRYEQKGLRHRLLCDDCEGYLNTNFEDPFKRYWIDQNPLGRHAEQEAIILDDADYAQFKLFHLSVLWRASVCKLAPFSSVALGPHEEWIRQMLLAKDPGPAWTYPIMCVAIVGDDGVTQRNFFASPLPSRLSGHRGYTFTFCGCQWLYLVSSHRLVDVEGLTLGDDGRLPVLRKDVGSIFRRYHRGVRKVAGLSK